ncbi:ATP-NAD kinase [Mitosporidium daphniae]|uniref:ATP-NAD kinase n=1 Tax=Mitosporidium daphniae TaxID=1485682 RepID=A0A098VNY0_9MICR|nr:ATP-NAD kinase [Mitosporidium daphniae]XP_013239073.1 ATP-NAD kinase [Mitosporidium daphniae]KGG50777.1 ATP-NAD kinase [Mitosporidium daphniae]KGG52646.1 ATP-NAD kinase [Mitosporidium daphniae]|eukprot:XP_013237204.1 ATP-NAD kinase [Mitosporidium daphniae]
MNILIMCKDDAETIRMSTEFILQLDSIITYTSLVAYVPTSFCIAPSSCHNIHLETWDPGCEQLQNLDLVLAIGGDGTVLNAAWQFQGPPIPPILPIFLRGTLGFLTLWDLSSTFELLLKVPLNLPSISERMRLCCKIIYRTGDCSRLFHVLNECVVDKGAYGGLLKLELHAASRMTEASFNRAATSCDAEEPFYRLLSIISADGVIVATPTGSTAYSVHETF